MNDAGPVIKPANKVIIDRVRPEAVEYFERWLTQRWAPLAIHAREHIRFEGTR